MISILREFTKSWIFTLLMGLLIASFAVFGLRDVFSRVSDNVVISAGKRSMDTSEFKKRYDQIKQNAAQQGQVFTNEDFVAAGHDVEMLNALSKQLAFNAWLDQLGVKPSAKMVVDEIAKIPAFFNAVTGKFDKDSYRQRLNTANITENEFEQQTSDQIAEQQYMDAAMAGLHAPRIYAAANAALMAQTRDASFFLIGPPNVPAPPVPSEADIQAYYKEKAPILTQPEIRRASVIQFAPAVFADKIEVSDDDLMKAYKFRLDSLGTPETRTFTQISAPNADAAGKISAALKAGGDPDAVAKANKGTVIDNVDKPKSAVSDAKIADAAFAMKTGEVSGPLQGDLGYAVLKMGEIKIGSTPSFDSVRAQLKAEIQQERAADKVNEVVNAFQKAHDAGEDFAATAKTLGLEIQSLPPMSAAGQVYDEAGRPARDKNGQPIDASKTMPPQVLKDIFDLSPGGSSDVEELGSGMYVALRLDGVRPAGVVALDDELRKELIQSWQAEKIAAAVTAKSEDALSRLANGEAFAKVAADMKAPVQSLPNIDRATASQKLGPQITGQIFSQDAGKAFEVPYGNSGIAMIIGRVDAVHQGSPAAANSAATATREQMSESIAQDIQTLTQTGAIAAMKTKTFPAVADAALDVKPTAKGSASSSSSKAKP